MQINVLFADKCTFSSTVPLPCMQLIDMIIYYTPIYMSTNTVPVSYLTDMTGYRTAVCMYSVWFNVMFTCRLLLYISSAGQYRESNGAGGDRQQQCSSVSVL